MWLCAGGGCERRGGSPQPADAGHGPAATAGRGLAPRGLTDHHRRPPFRRHRGVGAEVRHAAAAAAVRGARRADTLRSPGGRATARQQLTIHRHHTRRRSGGVVVLDIAAIASCLQSGMENMQKTTTPQPFNGPFSGTTRLSRYQKGKNQSGFYWSKRQWVALASVGPCASLHLTPDR